MRPVVKNYELIVMRHAVSNFEFYSVAKLIKYNGVGMLELRTWGVVLGVSVLAGIMLPAALAQASVPESGERTDALGQVATATEIPGAVAATSAPSYYRPVRGFGLQRQAEPPAYVRPLEETWLKADEGSKKVDWLSLGLESRLRYEYRDNDFRRKTDNTDQPILERTRFYASTKDKSNPLGFTVELQDSRRFNSVWSPDNKDINKLDAIQLYGEVYLKDALGVDDRGNARPVDVQVGRISFELTDKRLIARNEWRNTTNAFQGVRTILGQQGSDWQANVFALQPVIKLTDKADEVDRANWLYGAAFDWRKWSDVVTLQPYYYLLRQDANQVKYVSDGTLATGPQVNREIHTGGLRGYGVVGTTGLDYDLNYAKQWGDNGGKTQDAYAYNVEVGYIVEQSWKTRLSGSLGFASGDKDPNDSKSQRFERLFGLSRGWSASDYIQMENIYTPKVRAEVSPTSKIKADIGYSWYQLASATDRWNGGAALQDRNGLSGKNIGEEFDVNMRYTLNKYLMLRVGYAHFMAGDFTKKTSQIIEPGRKENSNLVYIETTLYAF